MKQIKVLVLGASGMVGHVVAMRLKEFSNKFNVLTVARSSKYVDPGFVVDALDFKQIEKVIKQAKPDVVINAIGVLNREAADLKLSVKLNSELPVFLSQMGREQLFQLIQISTDCVFSGNRGSYTEMDVPDAVDDYGISKRGGEQLDHKDLVIRTSIIGPEIRPQGIGLLHWFLKQKGVVFGYENVIWSGVTSLVLADAIIYAMNQKMQGLWHLVNNESISKASLLEIIQINFPNELREVKRTPLPISDKSLINSRGDVTFNVPTYSKMLVDLRMWMSNYSENYSDYLIKI
jgi:dTDP-4-dehydrorhamnose reductase